jgi:SAM-dependent methyltransferase
MVGVRMVASDRELLVGSLAHYEDAAYYTDTYRHRIEDVAYYVDVAMRLQKQLKRPVRVLEYGVGNGRVALPLARHGAEVTGVDWAPAMLADLRSRVRLEARAVRDRIRLRRGDMRNVRLGATFDLVICGFNTALHLYSRDDVERFLAGVHAHIGTKGLFVCDLAVPMPEDLARKPTAPHRVPNFTHPTAGKVRYQEFFDYDAARQVLFIALDFTPVAKPEASFMTPVAHRQFFPLEWEALLHYNHLEVTKLAGDFTGEAFDRNSEVMIWHAKRGAKRRTPQVLSKNCDGRRSPVGISR